MLEIEKRAAARYDRDPAKNWENFDFSEIKFVDLIDDTDQVVKLSKE